MSIPVRRSIAATAAGLALLACAGCQNQSAVSQSVSSSSLSSPSSQEAVPETPTGLHQMLYTDYLLPLADNGSLMENWTEEPQEGEYGVIQDLEVTASSKEGNVLTLTAELYGTVLVDPATMEDSLTGDGVAVVPAEDAPHYPFIALGTATVELRETVDGPLYLSCSYQPYDSPGVTCLKERTQELEPQLSASQKPDLSPYDPRVVEYIRQVILSQRYIESSGDITQWDLENLCTNLTFNYQTLGDENGVLPDGYTADSQILRLMPNLEFFSSYLPLTDYSVFENMFQLKNLHFYFGTGEADAPEPDLSDLRIGHVTELAINEFREDKVIDLSASDVDSLAISSWVASVTEFRGCEDLGALQFSHTRSDTRIINAQTFPSLKGLNLEFFSDTPRFRDLSQLATFGEDVDIRLSLSYQAANNKTVETLAGVRLVYLFLDPSNGPYPLDEPDPALVDQIDAAEVAWAAAG